MDTGGFTSSTGVGDTVIEAGAARYGAEVDLTMAVASLDAIKAWAADGSRSPITWLCWRLGITRLDAARLLRRARLVRRLDRIADALAVGKLSLGAADLLASAVTKDRVELAQRDEELLLESALGLSIIDLERYLARWRALADDELGAADAVNGADRRSLHLSPSLFGRGELRGDLDPELTALLGDALEKAERPDHDGETRTPAQRRHDALWDLLLGHIGAVDVNATITLDVLAGDGPPASAPAPISTASPWAAPPSSGSFVIRRCGGSSCGDGPRLLMWVGGPARSLRNCGRQCRPVMGAAVSVTAISPPGAAMSITSSCGPRGGPPTPTTSSWRADITTGSFMRADSG